MENRVHYAGFWRRFAASLLDTVVLLLPISLLMPASTAATRSLIRSLLERLNAALAGVQPAALPWRRLIMVTGPQTLASTVAIVIFWVTVLGTPGKLLLRCRVVDARSGKRLSIRQAIVRNLAYVLSLLPLGLGFLWIAWDPRKQGFHDKLAGSIVIVAARGGAR
ncbi:MAG: RDD family protein [Acidiferrobacteraceae bacterium]